MHVAIGLAMGMYLFALVMVVLNLAAFAPNGFVWKICASPGANREQPETCREVEAH